MNKKVLIISPYFAPSNAADMQRVRMSFPYFRDCGWDAEVVTVDPVYSEMVKDELLLENIPKDIKIHTVKALSKKWTSKLGLGSLGLRSIYYYRKKVNQLLAADKYELIYFSTTQFPVCILGSYWKKKFGVPFVIDMQDPWHSDYYQDKPKEQRPAKYWFSYRLHKYLEPKAMKQVDGLISVSEHYITDLKNRYDNLKDIPAATITFGAFAPDLETALDHQAEFSPLLQDGFVNVVYIGRGGMDMHRALSPVFEALKKGLEDNPGTFNKLKFYFIGTSYARLGELTILPLAKAFGVEEHVIELPERISYYHALATLKQADGLLMPGSDDAGYTASKLYPCLLTGKPLLAIFHKKSNAVAALQECAEDACIVTFDEVEAPSADAVYKVLNSWAKRELTPVGVTPAFDKYSARNLTGKQVELFECAIKHYEATDTNA